MRAAGCQDGAVRLKMPIPHYDDTITELAVKSLVVQLLEDLFKVSRKIHDPVIRGESLSAHPRHGGGLSRWWATSGVLSEGWACPRQLHDSENTVFKLKSNL